MPFQENQDILEPEKRESNEKTLRTVKSSVSLNSLERLSGSPKLRDSLKSFKTIMACYTAIHMFEKNEIYGAELFWVETYNHRATNLPKYMNLAVKFNGISFFSLGDKKMIKKIGYNDIFETVSQPKSLLLRLKNEFYRFNTFKSFEICQIVEEYKKFRKAFNIVEE